MLIHTGLASLLMYRLLVVLLVLLSLPAISQEVLEGFYKDLYVDAGSYLTNRRSLPSADSLGLSYEYLATSDESLTRRILAGSPEDSNGRRRIHGMRYAPGEWAIRSSLTFDPERFLSARKRGQRGINSYPGQK